MNIAIDVRMLRHLVAFDYLELFEVDNLDGITSFVERPVSPEIALPKDGSCRLVSRLVNMRFAKWTGRNPICIVKSEFPPPWKYDVIGVPIRGKAVPLMLVLYLRELPAASVDAGGFSAAVSVRRE